MAALVQKTSQFFFDGVTSTSRSITGVTAGNTVVATVAMCSQPNTSPTAAVPTPSGWSVGIAPAGATGISAYRPVAAIFYKANAASGTHTVSLPTLPTDTYGEVTIEEFSGLDTTTPLDQTSSNVTTSATSSAGVGTPSASSALGGVNVTIASTGGGSVTGFGNPTSSYTPIDSEPNPNVHMTYAAAYKIQGASSVTHSATYGFTGTSEFVGVQASFKNASGGPTAYTLVVDPVSYALTAAAETVTATRALTISPASYALTAAAVNLAVGRVLNVAPVSYALTAAAETVTATRVLNIAPVSYSLTAADVTLTYAPSLKELVVDPASYTLSLADVAVTATRALTIDPATYSLTNSAVTLSVGRVVNDAPVSYTLTASPITLAIGRVLSVDPASYALSAANVTLEYDTANPVLVVDPVSYVLTAAEIALEYGSARPHEEISYAVHKKRKKPREKWSGVPFTRRFPDIEPEKIEVVERAAEEAAQMPKPPSKKRAISLLEEYGIYQERMAKVLIEIERVKREEREEEEVASALFSLL